MKIVKYHENFRSHLETIDIQSHEWPWYPEAWTDLKDYKIFVAFSENLPRGFIIIEKTNIVKIGVSRKWRRKGIGRMLINKAIEIGAKTITIHEEDMDRIQFLRKMGFECIEVRRGLFPDGRDGLLFRR